jgi:hypothetical protein
MKGTEYTYPVHAENHAGYLHFGITTRDYIAIQAMAGLSANPELTQRSFDELADMAYRQADAMIKRSEVHE